MRHRPLYPRLYAWVCLLAFFSLLLIKGFHRHEISEQTCVNTHSSSVSDRDTCHAMLYPDSCSQTHVEQSCAICTFILTAVVPILGIAVCLYAFNRCRKCRKPQRKLAQNNLLAYFLRGPPTVC